MNLFMIGDRIKKQKQSFMSSVIKLVQFINLNFTVIS